MRLKTIFVVITIMLAGYLSAFAKEPVSGERKLMVPTEIVDTSYLSVGYFHRIYDPVLKISKCPDEILLIGNNSSWYGSYGIYQLDSLVRSRPDMSSDEFGKIYRELDTFPECLLKDFQASSYRFCGHIFSNYYKYQEEIPHIDWKLYEETDTILGQKCMKATCDFRGRHWTAWYTDIPISDGPWMFTGLPGLILRLEDSKAEHLIEAFEIRENSVPFGMPKHLYIKTKRDKYLKELADYKNNPWKNLEMLDTHAVDQDGKKVQPHKKKLFYNPIELK